MKRRAQQACRFPRPLSESPSYFNGLRMVASVLISLISARALGKSEASLPSRSRLTCDQQVAGWGNRNRNPLKQSSSQLWNSLYKQAKHSRPFSKYLIKNSDRAQSPSSVSFNVLFHLDEFPTEVFTAGDFSNEQATKDEGEEPSVGADDASVPTSQVAEADDGCTAMAMKKHNAVGDDPSDNDASDSDDDEDEEELSLELSETELDELTAEAFSHSFTNSQSLNRRRSHLGDDNMRGDIKTSHDEVSEDEDDIDQVNIDMDIVLSPDDEEEDLSVLDANDNALGSHEATAQHDISSMNMEDVLLNVIQSHVYIPPTFQQLMEIVKSQKEDDAFSKKNGLDRRTFYRSLLLEFLGEIGKDSQNDSKFQGSSKGKAKPDTKSKRKFLDEHTVARQLRSTLSLATQPRWRRHMLQIAHRHVHGTDLVLHNTDIVGAGSGLKLYSEDTSGASITASCVMQETLLMALAHSLKCGMVTLDDSFFSTVRKSLAAYARQGTNISKDTLARLKNGDILDALFKFANQGALRKHRSNNITGANLSALMKRDLMTWEDPYSESAVSSFEKQVEFEKNYLLGTSDENSIIEDAPLLQGETDFQPLPLVVYLRADSSLSKDELEMGSMSSTKILQSKSSMDRLLSELRKHDSIHLICLGKECDFDKVEDFINDNDQTQQPTGMDMETKSGSNPPPVFGGPPGFGSLSQKPGQGFPAMSPGSNTNPFLQAMQNAFANAGYRPPNSSGPPVASPMNPSWNGGFGPNNNASGIHDPEGSQRFNIFLARTIDESGNPGIMGAVAPPSAGNVFPLMFNMMQQRQRNQQQNLEEKNYGKIDGNSNPLGDVAPGMSQPWGMPMNYQQNWQTNPLPGMQIPTGAQFFNASIHISGMTMNNNADNVDGSTGPVNPWGNNAPPPELLQKAMEMAMTQVVERLADANANGHTNDNNGNFFPNIQNVQGNLPPPLSKAFSTILANEQLRRGIAENLARAAPALLDPRCQGVMLSVYVPPGPDNPNRGKMPGGSNGAVPTPPQQQPGNYASTSSKGSWFQKILSSPMTSNDPSSQDDSTKVTEDDKREKLERKAAKRLLFSKSRSKGSDKNSKSTQVTPSLDDECESLPEKSKARAQSALLKRMRNIHSIESMCHTSIPIAVSQDPVKKKLWNGWITRQSNARFFRKNMHKLEETLKSSGLQLLAGLTNDYDANPYDEEDHGNGTLISVSPILRAMLSVKDCTEDMTEVVRVALEIEAERTLRETDFSTRNGSKTSSEEIDGCETTPIHLSSLQSALALVCKVMPHVSGTADSISSNASPKRTREDLMHHAADKHERALCQNIIFPENIGVTYDQIGGLDEVKELLRQSITYPLKYPSLYSEGIARESCKGVLLFGPPGTGKTMLAKAVATEGGATFLSVDASSVENKWLGESEKNAKAVFTLARRLAPCVIFLDEVDSLLSSREGTGDDSAHGTLTSVKTTMMSEWDGLNSGTNGENAPRVIVIGSTNRPFDLDEAVLRRFPRRILVDLPDLDTRREILEVTMAENRVDHGVNFTSIAERLEGYTGSDIKEVCREAVVRISHEQAKMLDRGMWSNTDEDNSSSLNSGTLGRLQRLRPVKMEDFEISMNKLKRSVSEKGRELARVWEWNDEYGEIKRKDRTDALPQLMNMFL